jgi:hypothetical protein
MTKDETKEEVTKLIMASYDQGVKDAQQEVIATIKQLTAVIRVDEREACAKVCDSLEEQCEKLGVPDEKWPTPADCAAVIRARGEA